MSLRRAAGRLAVSLLVAVVLLGALLVGLRGGSLEHGTAAEPTAMPAAVPTRHIVLALGDSVPSGHACSCRPFPETYGTLLGAHTGTQVTVDNRAVSGLDTGGLLDQLRSPGVQDAVRRADVFLVTIGANDFGDHHDQVVDGRCETANTDCVNDEVHSMGRNLASALATIRGLRQGRPTTVLVTGYWNVFEDGAVARHEFGESGVQDALRLTRRANAVIDSVTTGAGATYVDLFRPFEHSGRDVTSLLAGDGDHPDAAGHELIARSLLDAGLPPMR